MEEKRGIPEHMHKVFKGKKEKLLRMSEISLWLDHYDDIFSDFDPRPYSQRALSDDFLLEIKRASRDKTSGQIELKFLVKAEMRNKKQENLIRRRLKEHFKKHHTILQEEVKTVRNKGVYFTIFGILVMIAATFLLSWFEDKRILTNFLIILLEPAGWFLFWEGLNQIVFETKSVKPDLEFYEKMSRSEITFLSY